MSDGSHLDTNRRHWDSRVDAHVASPDSAVDRLVDDPDHVSSVVAFDRPRMGDVTGLRLLHLQCHIGTDTLSWAKLGATVTGLDLSGRAVEAARGIATRMGLDDARFVEGGVDEATTALRLALAARESAASGRPVAPAEVDE